MFVNYFIRSVLRVMSRSWVPGIEKNLSDFAHSYSAQLGPFHLLVLHLCSLDCDRVSMSIRALPWLRRVQANWHLGCRDVGFQICRGVDCTEQTGFHTYWWTITQCLTLGTILAARFSNYLFDHIPQWITSRWPRNVLEQATPWEDCRFARIGPFWLEQNDAFVLDHNDVYLGICLPFPWHENGRWQRYRLQLGYRACRGEELVRPSGFERLWIRPFSTSTPIRSK